MSEKKEVAVDVVLIRSIVVADGENMARYSFWQTEAGGGGCGRGDVGRRGRLEAVVDFGLEMPQEKK